MPSRTAEKIKQVSLRLFAQEGYDGASLSKITDEVGIRKSSLYNHFKNKEALFLTLVDDVYARYVAELNETVHEGADDESVDTTLHKAFIMTTDFLRKEEVGRFYMHFLLFPPKDLKLSVHERFLRFEEELNLVLLPVITRGMNDRAIEKSSPADVLDAFYCVLDGISAQMFYYDPDTVNRKRQHAWNVFWRGIRAD
ncbi:MULTISPECIES: TetR/AcrR family transcriptional regulator [Alteribacter]|uniref:TetR/AcrR family transcriptional regulator n=1 Tax=Alteribacter keqinensis TaxID=2483800 RepID=A0A3M7TQR9_9BACI|nr:MULTISPECIES: TetR/AcrR family transcriptional regulator [Alteribacter]MBM7095294.1 TetR/AcrR family transcriptional regulator [Alteribacter salitolerans]RNA67039.1 TetR/AcrR family transcriptional regulator [Alteribacter keqinensis]